MEFVAKLLQGLSFVPAIVQGIEGLLKNQPGLEKRAAALSFMEETLLLGQAVASRQVTDQAKFKEGLGKMIDGAVECLNASSWAGKSPTHS